MTSSSSTEPVSRGLPARARARPRSARGGVRGDAAERRPARRAAAAALRRRARRASAAHAVARPRQRRVDLCGGRVRRRPVRRDAPRARDDAGPAPLGDARPGPPSCAPASTRSTGPASCTASVKAHNVFVDADGRVLLADAGLGPAGATVEAGSRRARRARRNPAAAAAAARVGADRRRGRWRWRRWRCFVGDPVARQRARPGLRLARLHRQASETVRRPPARSSRPACPAARSSPRTTAPSARGPCAAPAGACRCRSCTRAAAATSGARARRSSASPTRACTSCPRSCRCGRATRSRSTSRPGRPIGMRRTTGSTLRRWSRRPQHHRPDVRPRRGGHGRDPRARRLRRAAPSPRVPGRLTGRDAARASAGIVVGTQEVELRRSLAAHGQGHARERAGSRSTSSTAGAASCACRSPTRTRAAG